MCYFEIYDEKESDYTVRAKPSKGPVERRFVIESLGPKKVEMFTKIQVGPR